ncbi:disease resistance protein RPV1-like isoform X2 [Nymphaea colorata]|uniref:disease resistance protein RPV1-like isoform X2 n=1 Tax=Nymphaea colorata TaxID=210225 RepID=UPI00129D988F|nr:disease resistance protein RPV1-like isoform X2 [Nymphaea colorata]
MVLTLPKPTSTIVIFTFLSVVSVTVAISWLRRSKRINRSHVGRITVSEAQKPSPPPPKGHGFEFDVFLSFRGEDTRKTFTELLYDGLEMQGIHTFKDDEKLKKGERVESLLDAIDKSKLFVPILSKNYADSRWCLMEIAKIVSSGRLIIPVFFDVDPSDIRRQKGPFEAAFRKHEGNKELTERTVDEWRGALRKVGEISGYDLKNETDGHEGRLIKIIIKRVLSELNEVPFDVAKQPIGIESRVGDVIKMLDMEGNDFRMVGIHGEGGIGKTTIAKAVYNQLFPNFESSCFLFDVGKVSVQSNGLVTLQNCLLNDFLKTKNISISNVEQGISIIRRRVSRKRVLLILDDVDHIDQLGKLAGSPNWFGEGSKIIITTRNRDLLVKHHLKEHEIYKPKELDTDQSLQLFSRHAFMNDKPMEGYLELSKKVIRFTEGLPLALEVFGSLFYDIRTKNEWKEMIEQLERVQDKDIYEKLKISYEGLTSEEKIIFLDIACFFVGSGKEDAILMWKDCGLFPNTAIKVLVHKSLVKIDKDKDKFVMHDQIRDMGRKIVREEGLLYPGLRSRLWGVDDVLRVLENPEETRNETEGIFLYFTSQWKRHLYLSTKAFSTMPKLRMLNLNFSTFQECDLQHFPRKLKWLEWRACPLESLTWDGNLLDLVVLDLSHSKVKQIWNEKTLNMELRGPLHRGNMVFRRLKVLNLSGCSSLVATPDFACVPCLVKLILDTCYHLLEIDESIECLEDLVYLSMQWCVALTELPTGVTKLGSLEILNLSNCQNIWALPERVGEMESLTEMCLDSTQIRKLPESIVELSNLCKLSLKECALLEELPHCIGRLESLQVINLEGTAVTKLPDSIGELKSLNQLSLKGCKLLELPDSIGQLESLRDLILDVAFLMSIPDSIGNLNSLHRLSLEGHELIKSALSSTERESPEETITGCNLVTRLPDSIGHLRNLHQLWVDGCPSLVELPDAIGNLETLEELTLAGTKVRKLPCSIGELKNLYMLSLKDSELLEELPQSIGNLESLRELILDRCTSLRDIPDSIRYLQNLSQLSLKECKSLEEVPDSFEDLKCLKELILEGTSLKRLPNSIEGLHNLIQLSLNGSDLFEELPDSIGRLESLKELNLDSTRIRNLPESIVHLKNLNQLSLYKCELLEEIPESIGELKSLESIMVDECGKLRSLPDSVGLLERLETLSMNGLMDMRVLPSSMEKLKSLVQLNISNTGIREMFHEFGGLTKLKTIDLSNNPELIALPSSFFLLSSLEKLVAHGCNWLEGVDATCFGKLPSLKILDLSHSGFCSIPSSVRRLSLLEELILEDCKRIQSLPRLPPSLCTLDANGCTALESISDIPKLKVLSNLNLRGCRKLTSLCGLERLKYLTCLYMDGCESLGADIMESLSKEHKRTLSSSL